MTTKPLKTPQGKLKPGDQIHFKRPISAFGFVRGRGDSLTLTADMIAGSIDRLGRSWLDRVDDEDGPIGRGAWPDGQPKWSYGTPDWEEARETARRVAWSHADPKTRAESLAHVEEIFGPSLPTSRTLNSAPDPSIRIADGQEQRRRLAGVRQVSTYTPSEREV